MICRNCGSDVRPDRFCSNCGGSLNVQYCSYCGSAVAAGSARCSNCGRPVTVPQTQGNRAPASGYRSPNDGVIDDYNKSGYAPPTSSGLKARSKKTDKERSSRTGFQTLLCLICGIAALGALGYVLYNLLMGSLFSVPAGGVYPLPSVEGSFGIIPNFQGYIDSYISFYETISSLATSGAEITTIIASIFTMVPGVLFLSSVPIAVLMIGLSAIIAIFRFISGMCSGKFFTLSSHLGWALSGLLIVLLSAAFAGLSGYVTIESGLALCLILCTAAIGVCVLGNIFFAGKRFLRGGSIMKFLTNGGIVAGAIVAAFSLPLMFFDLGAPSGGSLGLAVITAMTATNDFTMPQFALYAIIALMTIKCIFGLPAFVRKSTSRLAKTFKFDGFEDVGFMRKSFFFLLSILLLTVPVFILVYGNMAEGAVISNSVYVFIAGGVIAFVSAILNRIFLNSDQK